MFFSECFNHLLGLLLKVDVFDEIDLSKDNDEGLVLKERLNILE